MEQLGNSPFSQFDGLRPQGDAERLEVTGRRPRARPLALAGILRGGALLTFYESTPWPSNDRCQLGISAPQQSSSE